VAYKYFSERQVKATFGSPNRVQSAQVRNNLLLTSWESGPENDRPPTAHRQASLQPPIARLASNRAGCKPAGEMKADDTKMNPHGVREGYEHLLINGSQSRHQLGWSSFKPPQKNVLRQMLWLRRACDKRCIKLSGSESATKGRKKERIVLVLSAKCSPCSLRKHCTAA
jgi:hypothetical protein